MEEKKEQNENREDSREQRRPHRCAERETRTARGEVTQLSTEAGKEMCAHTSVRNFNEGGCETCL